MVHDRPNWICVLDGMYKPADSYDGEYQDIIDMAKKLWDSGMTQINIADALNVSRARVNYWKKNNWQVRAKNK